jgi:hypothetical protein
MQYAEVLISETVAALVTVDAQGVPAAAVAACATEGITAPIPT